MRLIMRPQDFDVVVTTNLFGDILSNEASGLVGGLGMAPGLNVGEQMALAQAAHGSAPDIADQHVGNPSAMILSGRLLLEWLATRFEQPTLREAAARVERAVRTALERGKRLTPDLGGDATTEEMAHEILAAVE
jgi:3-isopropylmalate dehydrogenase